MGKFGQPLPQPNFADLTGAFSRLVIGWLLKPVVEPASQLGEYVYGPACKTDGQLAVIGIQDMAEVAHRVYPAIERSLGVENFSPGAGVPPEAHSVLSVVPLPVTGVDNDQKDIAGIVPTFEGDDVIGGVGVSDLARG